jgi:hypothetical protein
LAKKWQEIEFLDLKERQIRRRAQKTKEVKQEIAAAEPEQTRRKGLVFGLVAVVVVVGGVVVWQAQQAKIARDVAKRSLLAVTEVKGEVEWSTPTSPVAALKDGVSLPAGFTVKQGAAGRTVLTPFLDATRFVVKEKAVVEFDEVKAEGPEHADRLTLRATLKLGTFMVEARSGDPRIEVRLPGGVRVRTQQAFFKAIVDEKGASDVQVRDGVAVVEKTDGSKKREVVKVDHRLIVSGAGEWQKPQGFQAPETVWR